MLNLFQRKPQGYRDIHADELHALLDSNSGAQLVDVRSRGEYKAGHLANARLLPLPELASRLSELDPQEVVILYCHSGARSQRAARMLAERGFGEVGHLAGGIVRWKGGIVR
jgi:rhodanese-related sulfurtransferase